MSLILRHELECQQDGCIVTIYINPQTSEFSKELDGCNNILECKSCIEQIQDYVRKQFPDVKVKLVKIMLGAVVVATVSFSGIMAGDVAYAYSNIEATQASYSNYSVIAGDSLWSIASKFKTTISEIKAANNLISDSLYIGQILKIPQNFETTLTSTSPSTYKVVAGDSLYLIANRFNTSVATIKTLNNMTTETIFVGQLLKVPATAATTPEPTPTPTPAPAPTPTTATYTVASGDTLWILSTKFKTTIANIKTLNNLTSDTLMVGQVLKVPSTTTQPAPSPAPASQDPSITYITHKVAAGDNSWNLSIKYGIPMSELLKVNGFTQSTVLSIGQEVKIPVHNIPVINTPAPQYGERLDWWTQAQYVLPINKTARIIDFATGRSFMIKRTTGAFHADSEPLTAADSAIIKEVWGGAYSWTTRAVIVEVDGRRIAASMASMPHDVDYIADNGFSGHFDLHFYNSTRHKDGLIDPYHQRQIAISSGIPQ